MQQTPVQKDATSGNQSNSNKRKADEGVHDSGKPVKMPKQLDVRITSYDVRPLNSTSTNVSVPASASVPAPAPAPAPVPISIPVEGTYLVKKSMNFHEDVIIQLSDLLSTLANRIRDDAHTNYRNSETALTACDSSKCQEESFRHNNTINQLVSMCMNALGSIQNENYRYNREFELMYKSRCKHHKHHDHGRRNVFGVYPVPFTSTSVFNVSSFPTAPAINPTINPAINPATRNAQSDLVILSNLSAAQSTSSENSKKS